MSAITALAKKPVKTLTPGSNLAVANLVKAARLAEKTIELTTCAQFGALFQKRMVWFGLTKAQERKFGFDAATNLGGRAFILQFKASRKVLRTGRYVGQRLFQCQHGQMVKLVRRFGSKPNSCFYFLPDIGTFDDLRKVSGNLLDNSYLVDVAGFRGQYPRPNANRDITMHI